MLLQFGRSVWKLCTVGLTRNKEKGDTLKTRHVNTFFCITLTLISLNMILLLQMRLRSIIKLLKLRDNLCNGFQHGCLGLKKL
jgi:hypothetical protein